MSFEKINKKREHINQLMDKLEKKQKMLKEKGRKIHTRKLIKAGELISRAGIEHLDPTTLLGALLEIKERSLDENNIKSWSAKGEVLLIRDKQDGIQPLILTFGAEPSTLAKSTLKNLKFKWNPFRKEWCGYGKKDEIESIFKDMAVKVEMY